MAATRPSTREAVPFRIHTADGETRELTYSSPRPADLHDEREVLETLPWFEPGKPLRNYMLHETDFYDEVEQIWGQRWGAEGIGTLREVPVTQPATFAGSPTRDHTARCRVLSRADSSTIGAPCVLASLGARDPGSGQRHRSHH